MQSVPSKKRALSRLMLACCAALSAGLFASEAHAQGYTAIGDSLTYGLNANPGNPETGSPHPDGFAPQFNARRVALGGDPAFHNRGVSGATSQDILSNQLASALGDAPDVITLTVGTNDIRVAVQSATPPTPQAFGTQFGTRLGALFSALRSGAPTRRIFATNVPPLQQLPAFASFDTNTKALIAAYVQAASAAFAQVAPQYGVTVVDLFSDANSVNPANISLPPAPGGDGIHPNLTGHTLLARKFFAAAGLQETPSLVVTRADDVTDAFDDQTTLREAIAVANGNGQTDTITFGPLFDTAQTITLSGTDLKLSSNLSIQGKGARLLTVSGNNLSRVFDVSNGATASISGLTIANGNATISGPGSVGGGINNAGNLTVDGCSFESNVASFTGGGLAQYDGGTALVRNSTFNGNSCPRDGGAITNQGLSRKATMTLVNCTIANNQSRAVVINVGYSNEAEMTVQHCTIANNLGIDQYPSGLINATNTGSATLHVGNTLLANNENGNIGDDGSTVNQTIISDGYNLSSDDVPSLLNGKGDQVSVDPKLAPNGLQNNGGPTQTIALVVGSPAINAGSSTVAIDQRGVARVGGADIGAYEFVNGTPVIARVTIDKQDPKPGDLLTAIYEASDPDGQGDTLTPTYQWLKNGSAIPDQTGKTLDLRIAANGRKGDKISVSVTLTDLFGSSDVETSSEVTIGNTIPVVNSVSIAPTTPSTGDVLTATVNASDPDTGDTLTYTYIWKKNGQVLVNETGKTLDLSKAGNGDDGDTITVTATANDGTADSVAVESPTVTIRGFLPKVDSLSPLNASDKVGNRRTFTWTVSDGNGAGDIKETWLLINKQLSWNAGATLIYVPSVTSPTRGQLFLRSGDAFLTPLDIGANSRAVVDNGAINVSARDVQVTTSGNGLTISVTATIRDGLVGTNRVFARVVDKAGGLDPTAAPSDNGYRRFGNYTVTPQFKGATNSVPMLSRLQPGTTNTTLATTGLGPVQTFSFSAFDADGTGDIESVWFTAGKSVNWTNSATFIYTPQTRRLVLRSDNGQSFLGGGAIGSAGIIENSQVRVDLSKVRASIGADGKTLVLVLPLQAKRGLLGQNKVYLRVQDLQRATAPNGDAQGYVQSGAWNVGQGTSATTTAAPSGGGS